MVGNTAARRLFDGCVVVKRVLRRDDRIREALSPSLSTPCRRKLVAPLAHAIASHIAGVRSFQGFETREEAETWVAAWSGAKSTACEGLKSPSGDLPWIA